MRFHKIDWILAIVFMHANQKLCRQVERRSGWVGMLCSIASMLCSIASIDIAVIVYNSWIISTVRQVACSCFHARWSVQNGLEGVQGIHSLCALQDSSRHSRRSGVQEELWTQNHGKRHPSEELPRLAYLGTWARVGTGGWEKFR